MSEILGIVWKVLNSPVGVAALAAVALWLLNRLYAAKPAWRQFEGTIIAAIKHAEKAIPDDTSNKATARLDSALRYVLNVYAEMTGKQAGDGLVASLKEGIQIEHASLEAAGLLK